MWVHMKDKKDLMNINILIHLIIAFPLRCIGSIKVAHALTFLLFHLSADGLVLLA